METPITIRCSSVNLYLVDCKGGKMMIDAGWPKCLPELKDQLKPHHLKLSDIRYVMVTHAHPDHAGLVQTLKETCGTKLVIHETQIPHLTRLKEIFARLGGPEGVVVDPGDLVLNGSNRAELAQIGVQGEFIHTPGHSDDSFSLVLDNGMAFIGDLTRPDLASDENATELRASWERLVALKPQVIYPGHGSPIPVAAISAML